VELPEPPRVKFPGIVVATVIAPAVPVVPQIIVPLLTIVAVAGIVKFVTIVRLLVDDTVKVFSQPVPVNEPQVAAVSTVN
jgi:hypothetical protein